MNKTIIHQNTDGSIGLTAYSPKCGIAIQALAAQVVPKGQPFVIAELNAATDRTFRNAWTYDFSEPHGHGADFAAGSDLAVIDWVTPNHPIVEEAQFDKDGQKTCVIAVHSWGDLPPLEHESVIVDVKIDMAKAREIKRTMIRAERTEALSALDVKYMRALERGDTSEMKTLAAQKQALRDAPAHPDIEAAETVDQLLAIELPK
jgi:hypothetical protein